MGAAGNKKPKGMHKKHAPAYQVEEAIHENDLKKGKKKLIVLTVCFRKRVIFRASDALQRSSDITLLLLLCFNFNVI